MPNNGGHVSDTEKLSSWMIDNHFVTGHADTVDDLFRELSAQVKELRNELYALRTAAVSDGKFNMSADQITWFNNIVEHLLPAKDAEIARLHALLISQPETHK